MLCGSREHKFASVLTGLKQIITLYSLLAGCIHAFIMQLAKPDLLNMLGQNSYNTVVQEDNSNTTAQVLIMGRKSNNSGFMYLCAG